MKKLYFILYVSFTGFISNAHIRDSVISARSVNSSTPKGYFDVFPNSNTSLSNINKPIIIVEDFDPKNELDASFLREVIRTDKANYLGIALENQGYDIITFDFAYGADYVQNSAFALQKLIRLIDSTMSGNEQIVIMGLGTGGLVARYALAELEDRGISHNCGLFISFDAPQKGMNVQVGFQKIIDNLVSVSLGSFGILSVMQQEFYDHPMVDQLLLLNRGSGHSSDFTNLFNNLDTLNDDGYPHVCKNIALSNGSFYGELQKFKNGSGQLVDLFFNDPILSGNISSGGTLIFEYECYTPTPLTPPSGSPGWLNSFATFYTLPNPIEAVSFVGQVPVCYDRVPGSIDHAIFDFFVEVLDGMIGSDVFSNHWTAIPTVSALGITNMYEDTLSNVTDLLCQTPFDAIHVTAFNKEHFGINVIQANWIYDQIITMNEDTIRIENEIYNYGKDTSVATNNFITKTTLLDNNAILAVNNTTNMDYDSRNSALGNTLPSPTDSSLFVVYLPKCSHEPIDLVIKNGSRLVLGDTISRKGELRVGSGNSIVQYPTSIIRVNNHSKLTIEEGATLKIYPNSQIILDGADAILEIKGTLILTENSTFKITAGPNGRGFVRWNMAGIFTSSQAQSRISLGNNSKIELVGTGNNDKIMEVADNLFWPDCNNGAINTQVILRSCKVEMGVNARLNLGTPINFYNIKISPKSGVSTFKGITLWGYKHHIVNTEITGSKGGLQSFNIVGGNDFKAHGLKMNYCQGSLGLEGKGYSLVLFESDHNKNSSGRLNGVTATGIDRQSTISASTMDSAKVGVRHTGSIGAGLSIYKSTIKATEKDIEVRSPSSVLARCNNLYGYGTGAMRFGIENFDGSIELGPVLGRGAGFNYFSGLGQSVYLNETVLYLNNGYNNLSSGSCSTCRAVCGTLPYGSPLDTIIANHNQWDLSGNPPRTFQMYKTPPPPPPPTENYNIYCYPGVINLLVKDSGYVTTSFPYLTFRDSACNPSGIFNAGGAGGLKPSTKVINTMSFSSTNLKNAFETTLGTMYDTLLQNPVTASGYWKEILTSPVWVLPISNNDFNYITNGINKMMENVGNYLINDTNEANSLTLFNTVLSNAKTTLQFWQNLTSNDTNYNLRYLSQQAVLAKAHILHHANEYSSAISLMDSLAEVATGIFARQADYWQCQWERENAIKSSEFNPDSVALISPCYYDGINANAIFTNWYNKGVEEYKPKVEDKISKHLTLYPNPATTSVTAELETSQKGTATINLYSIDGKCVKTIENIKLQLGINKLIIPVFDIIPGVYTIAIETRNIKWNEKVIIE